MICGGGEILRNRDSNALFEYDATREAMRKIVAALFHDSSYPADDEYVHRRHEASIAPGAWESLAAARFRRPDAEPGPGVGAPKEDLPYKRVGVRTLVVEGGDDKIKPSGWSEEIAAGIPDATATTVADAAHCPQIEQAAAVDRLLLDFFARSGPGQDFAGKRVVVTGCASGIGEQVALVLAERGAEVIGLDRDPIATPVAESHAVDFADSASILATATAIANPVDALVNVAGVTGTLAPELVVGINFVGTRELTAALLPRLGEGGAIVNTSSLAASRYLERRELIAGLLATPDREAATAWCVAYPEEVGTGYAVSKDAIVWWTLGSAVELAGRGIRINCVAPGTTATPIIEDVIRSRGEEFLKAIPMPLGRMAAPREQAEVLVFLASPAASYLSGQVIWPDGGYLAGVAAGQLDHVTGSVGPAR